MRLLITSLALTLYGCVSTVQVQVRPLPSVNVDLSAVSVVSASRSCTEVANAVVQHLTDAPGIHVSPDATLRIQLDDCALTYHPRVELRQEVGSDGRSVTERTATVDGRAYAMVSLTSGDTEQARLLASARETTSLSRTGASMFKPTRADTRSLRDALVDDLVRQVSPMPRLVQRRLYPGAPSGSARDLYNQAVLAEASGDLNAAHRLATLAISRGAAPPITRYAEELERHLDHPGR